MFLTSFLIFILSFKYEVNAISCNLQESGCLNNAFFNQYSCGCDCFPKFEIKKKNLYVLRII